MTLRAGREAGPGQGPAIWLDCGLEDGLLRDNQALHAHLKKLKIKHEYHEFPSHNWAYWDEHGRKQSASTGRRSESSPESVRAASSRETLRMPRARIAPRCEPDGRIAQRCGHATPSRSYDSHWS